MAPNILERAYELARSGRFRTISEITNLLMKERFDNVRSFMSGGGIRAELRTLMKRAAAAGTADTPAPSASGGQHVQA